MKRYTVRHFTGELVHADANSVLGLLNLSGPFSSLEIEAFRRMENLGETYRTSQLMQRTFVIEQVPQQELALTTNAHLCATDGE